MKRVLVLCVLVFTIFGWSKTLKIVTDDWEPYYGPNLKDGGYISEITREAFKRAGYEVEITFYPWKRALEYVKMGNADVLMGMYFTEERTQFLEYSDPIDKTQVAFYTLRDRSINYEKLYDLKNYKIGVIRGYSNTKEFDEATFLIKDESTDIKQNINKLLNKRTDMIIGSKKVILHQLQSYQGKERDSIKIIDPPLEIKNLYIGITKKNPDAIKIRDDFNKGLKLMMDDGTYDKILEKYGF
ncbi:MAG: transporter substrate-binding domain-containing protein [Candidatus Delongbacteria bacterium]|nr:transporter substrate-binding domain-containing protein [Candidatus Delongbacteria bacterium]MBN2835592.1 transporter substrate-binding domain-containing protein [Candidatus Delongbacteria bacterium]